MDLVRTGRFRLASIIYGPALWRNPLTGAANVTGVIGSAFAWDKVLSGTLPSYSIVYVVVGCAQLESNFNFSSWSSYAPYDTSLFTLKVTGVNVANLGWGDLRPPAARGPEYDRQFTFRIGNNPYTLTVGARTRGEGARGRAWLACRRCAIALSPARSKHRGCSARVPDPRALLCAGEPGGGISGVVPDGHAAKHGHRRRLHRRRRRAHLRRL